jgi:PAS domain S-box-containing protein
MRSERRRPRETLLLWLGIGTAGVVSAYRISLALATPPSGASIMPTPAAAEFWVTNICLLWSLALFALAWGCWRETRRRQEQLELIMASVKPDVLLVVDPDRTIRMCNPSVRDMFGYEPDALLGTKTDALYPDRRATGVAREIHDHLDRFGCHVGPATGVRKDGKRIPLEIMTSLLGVARGAILMIRDITERRRTEELQESLTHMMVHDLRNPLFGISANLQLAAAGAGDALPGDARECLADALAFSKEMGEMISSVLDVHRLEAGELPLSPVECDLAALAGKAVAMLAPLARERRLELLWSPAPLKARCDPELIERVIANLVRNAVEATPSGGRIAVTGGTGNGKVKIAVADNGPGIPGEYHALIFDKFGQVRTGITTKRRSAGLGLTFCKLVVEAHGGRIGVESEVGQGSTFWFELAADGAPGTATPTGASQQETPAP